MCVIAHCLAMTWQRTVRTLVSPNATEPWGGNRVSLVRTDCHVFVGRRLLGLSLRPATDATYLEGPNVSTSSASAICGFFDRLVVHKLVKVVYVQS